MTKQLRILIGADVHPDPNSGAAGTVIESNKALASLGHQVEAFWSDSLGRRIKHGNLHCLLELPRTYRREVRRRLQRQCADVVQLSQPYAYLAGKDVQERYPDTVMIWRSHGLEAKVDDALRAHVSERGSRWRVPFRAFTSGQRLRAQQAAVLWTDGAVVPCADDRDYLIAHFGARPERVRVIWHGVPDDYLDAPVASSPGRWRRLLHVSQMSANKGTDVMLRAVSEVLWRVRDATMTWVCPRSKHDAILHALREDVVERVELVDWGARESLRELYDSHGIFVFPTLAEGAAKAVMEAMSRGMCVVSSDTSGPRDYIQDGVNGYLVPVADADSMVQRVIEALHEVDGSARMGDLARQTAKAFRWRRCASQLVEFYLETKEAKGRQRR